MSQWVGGLESISQVAEAFALSCSFSFPCSSNLLRSFSHSLNTELPSIHGPCEVRSLLALWPGWFPLFGALLRAPPPTLFAVYLAWCITIALAGRSHSGRLTSRIWWAFWWFSSWSNFPCGKEVSWLAVVSPFVQGSPAAPASFQEVLVLSLRGFCLAGIRGQEPHALCPWPCQHCEKKAKLWPSYCGLWWWVWFKHSHPKALAVGSNLPTFSLPFL